MKHSHYFATEQERRLATRMSFARIKKSRKWRLSGLALVLLGMTGGVAIGLIPWRVTWLRPVIMACWIQALSLGLGVAWQGARTRELRKLLRERGVPICLHCGYDLRGLTEARCPECGNPFEPEILTWRQTDQL